MAEPLVEIVIPAYNEARRLPAGLAELCARLDHLPFTAAVLVVDNASSDQTGDVVRQWRSGVEVRLLHCPKRGKGAAVRSGILSTRAPIVGFCDADMATGLDALEPVLAMVRAGAGVVIGSRVLAGSIVEVRHSRVRAFGARLFRRLARRLVPGVRDTQCGFKFFDGGVARRAAAAQRATGFAFDVELLARCARLGAPPVEVPVVWRDRPGSTFSPVRHGLSVLVELIAIWAVLRRGTRAAAPAAAPPPPLRPAPPRRPEPRWDPSPESV